jgi:hypothetical protein
MKTRLSNLISKVKRSRLSSVPNMISLGNKKLLLMTLHSVAWRIISIATSKTKVAPRLRRFNKFITLVLKAYKHHGSTFTIKWLKASHMAVQKKISSHPFQSLREIERDLPLPRLINGLPSFIGTMDRRAIRLNHPGTIRLWLSILSIYRILEGPGKLNLGTITDPFKGSHDEIKSLTHIFTDLIEFNRLGRKIGDLSAKELIKSMSAGPNTPVAIFGLLTDAIGLAKYTEIYYAFESYCKITKSPLIKQLNNYIQWAGRALTVHGTDWVLRSKSVKEFDDIRLGKLAFKVEPAGKIRVFAIVDIWTQSLLAPLHNALFDILRGLPNDGTFDQDLSYDRCRQKAQLYNCAFSVDLSAATDRLPILLQSNVIDKIWSVTGLGKLWATILVDRPYYITDKRYGDENNYKNNYFYYQTGQPMGGLSSWAMLALTHHLIVQACAFRVYGTRKWTDKYEVLGDDLVIFDYLIYEEYIKVMKLLDVGVNPSKSLISENLTAFEFAKRTSTEGCDVSGISWKQFITENTPVGRVNIALHYLKKDYINSPSLLWKAMTDYRYTCFEDMLKDKRLRAFFENSIVGLIGSFIPKGKISLLSVVSLLVDPHDEGCEQMENPSIPLASTLRVLFEIVKSESEVIPSLSSFEDRVEMAKEEVLPYMADTILREALARITIFKDEYDSSLDKFASLIVNEDAIVHNFSPIEIAQLRSISEEVLLRGKDPEDLFDEIYNFSYKLRADLPSMAKAEYYSNKVDSFISFLDTKVISRAHKVNEIPRMVRDIKSAGKLSGTPYWKLLSRMQP